MSLSSADPVEYAHFPLLILIRPQYLDSQLVLARESVQHPLVFLGLANNHAMISTYVCAHPFFFVVDYTGRCLTRFEARLNKTLCALIRGVGCNFARPIHGLVQAATHTFLPWGNVFLGNCIYVVRFDFAWKYACFTSSIISLSPVLLVLRIDSRNFMISSGGVTADSPSRLLRAISRATFRNLYLGLVWSPLLMPIHFVDIGTLTVFRTFCDGDLVL